MDARSTSDDSSPKDEAPVRTACTECQRRKQKCNRQWPCNHCQKRKVVTLCSFNHDNEPNTAWVPSANVRQKRERDSNDDRDEWDIAGGLEAMGYTSSHLLANLEIDSQNKSGSEQYLADLVSSPQLRRALDILPTRRDLDALVQNFLSNVNYYYYIVYPPNFIREYAEWCRDRDAGKPLGLQWTCLIIMICACSVQHTDDKLTETLEANLGQSVKELTERYHDAARELHSAIPVGHSHFYSVQYLLHSCYWFKAEARFVECWQVLGATVREAQALGLHEEPKGHISDFNREMRRRLWCIVDSWDWLVSSLLARPMLIDRTNINIGLPSLTLEPFPVSPLLHLKLQSQLVGQIFAAFGPPKILTDPAQIQKYQGILEKFISNLPPAYAIENPDTVPEATYPWVALHRHYMQTCTIAIALGPFRSFMAKPMTENTPQLELKFRDNGIDYALKLLQAVQRFFEYVWSRDTTFHFVPFCIFDTAALLCSAVLHDGTGTLSRQDNVVDAVDLALATLKQLRTATQTAKTPYDVLRRLIDKVWPATANNNGDVGVRKRLRAAAARDVPNGPQAAAPSPYVLNQAAAPVETYSGYAFPDASIQPGGPTAHLPALGHGNSYGLSPPTDGSSSEPLATNPPAVYGAAPPWPNHQYQDPASNSPGMNGSQNWPGPDAQPPFVHMQQMPLEGANDMGFNLMPDVELGDLAVLWNWESLDLGFSGNPIL
ncbi:fungal-specific transcription factor domain-containing protein [Dactylonectria estremocensis]|uniref:Fungal-specific transcription factor domain-containing protein n=1 Tax=Dactylonectria estremocensis TaxID=1079267 RepID=A0A9P9EY08_9HYPO|nr:fungal-specific transcription factor domain-containing protein [Dactylonectria estremocensis]